MGEKQNQPFQLSFNPSLRVDFQGSLATSDSGLLVVRKLDEHLGLSGLISENIMDDRRGKNTQLPLPDLLRQSIYSRLATPPSSCLFLRQSGSQVYLYSFGSWRNLDPPQDPGETSE